MGLDLALARELAHMARFAYTFHADDLPPGSQAEVRRVCPPGDKPAIVAALAHDRHKRVLAFRGSLPPGTAEGVSNWAYNLGFLLVPWLELPGRVHAGFVAQLGKIFDMVRELLGDDRETPLFLTGHSLGGAMALLATQALRSWRYPVETAYTFAAPRVGDWQFARSYQVPVYRFEFGDDLVPHVPFRLPRGVGRIALQFLVRTLSPGLQEMFRTSPEGNWFESVGHLIYARPGERAFLVADDQQAALARQRFRGLLTRWKNIGEHHRIEHYLRMVED